MPVRQLTTASGASSSESHTRPAAVAPREAMRSLNRLIADFMPQGDHVTACYVRLDVRSGAVELASASHPGAYRLAADGTLTLLGGKGVPLGLGQELFMSRLESGQHRLGTGDALWLFTDGLVKAENPQGEPFGLERLEKTLRQHASLAPDALAARVHDAVLAFAGKRPLKDDAAIASIRQWRFAPATHDGVPVRVAATIEVHFRLK